MSGFVAVDLSYFIFSFWRRNDEKDGAVTGATEDAIFRG
jgi:hypothetical protein